MTEEDIFKTELEIFRKEAESAIQFYYYSISIQAELADEKVLEIINTTPLFWRTIFGALQTSLFIVLGRIFDDISPHSIHKLLRLAQEHTDIFSKEALGRRKNVVCPNAEWIEEYLENTYVPTTEDFRKLRKHVEKHRKVYQHGCKEIRNKIFAHKELIDPEEIKSIFIKINAKELQKMLVFLTKLETCLWELFNNGKKPKLQPVRYGLKSIKRNKTPEYQSNSLQERVILDTEKLFRILSNSHQ